MYHSQQFVIKYLYQCLLQFKYKIKQVENEIHKSKGKIFWLIEDGAITFIKPKIRSKSDIYFK